MEIKNTKIGRMFKILTPCSADNDYTWIREIDIIGISKFTERTYSSSVIKYYIRTQFSIGHGINGTDNLLSVKKDIYEAVAHELGIE